MKTWTKRAIIRNFSFFQSYSVPSTLNDWSDKTLTHCRPRQLEACAVCAIRDYAEHRFEMYLFKEPTGKTTFKKFFISKPKMTMLILTDI